MAEQRSLVERIEQQLATEAGINAAVELDDGTVVLSGMVDSAEAKRAAEDIVARLAPGRRIDNGLEVEAEVPANIDQLYAGEPSSGQVPLVGDADEARELGPDFANQTLLTNPVAAPGPSSSGPEDPVAEGDDVYTPPTDPVVTTDHYGQTQVLGGFEASSLESVEVERSAEDNRLGDAAIEDAIRRELREDATTTELNIRVQVLGGVAHLRGQVPGLEDAENAEAVAARVPGVVEVIEELEVSNL